MCRKLSQYGLSAIRERKREPAKLPPGYWPNHRQQVITRRSLFELKEAKRRAHILEGLKIALDNLDAVIKTIRRSRDVNTARKNLMRKFNLTEIQANAILEMQLRRLAALERKKIEDEYKEIGKKILYLPCTLGTINTNIKAASSIKNLCKFSTVSPLLIGWNIQMDGRWRAIRETV